jgi:antitoxin YefM
VAETTYSDLRQNLSRYLNAAVDDCETIVVRRRGKRDVALIALDELRSLQETVHALTPPRNGRRLLEAIAQAERGEGVEMTLEELRRWTAAAAEPGPTPPAHPDERDVAAASA